MSKIFSVLLLRKANL